MPVNPVKSGKEENINAQKYCGGSLKYLIRGTIS
jgi:hypothetical protein